MKCFKKYSKLSEGKNKNIHWSLGGAAVWHLPLAQGAILETQGNPAGTPLTPKSFLCIFTE